MPASRRIGPALAFERVWEETGCRSVIERLASNRGHEFSLERAAFLTDVLQLPSINAGGGYHILLAGMERITVELGQFVLTGEPVAVMGNGLRLASATAFDSSQPILYIEFRKDGNSIDPSPWWATSEDEKARG